MRGDLCVVGSRIGVVWSERAGSFKGSWPFVKS